MKIEVLEQKKNPLMKREEVVLSVGHDGKATPSRRDLLKEVARKLKVKENLLIIDRIFTASGKSQSSLKVLVYKKPGDIPPGKLEKMKARMEKKAKPAEGAKPAEKPKEEAKAEEAKREEAGEKKVEGEEKEKEAEEPKKEEGEKTGEEKEEAKVEEKKE